MKNIKFLGLTAAMFAMVISGCQDPGTEYRTRNFAYLSELSAINGLAYEKAIGSNETGTEFEFSVDLIDYAVEDIDVTVNVDAALVSGYNDANGTEYTAIPNANIAFSGEGVSTASDGKSATVTIAGGENRGTIKVNVTKWNEMIVDKEYAVVVSLSGSSAGDIVMAPGQWSTICFPVVLLNGPLNDALPTSEIPADGDYVAVNYLAEGTNFGLYSDLWNAYFTSDFTMELWLLPSGFSNNCQIFSFRQQATTRDGAGKSGYYKVKGGPGATTRDADEVFIRFEPNNSLSSGGTRAPMEIKAFNGSGTVPGYVWISTEWQHLAIVYNRRHNTLTIYRNGEQINKVDGYPLPLGRYIGSEETDESSDTEAAFDHSIPLPYINLAAADGGRANLSLAARELRIWNSARRATQIRDNMRKRVNVAEPNLVVYYPLDQASLDGGKLANLAEWAGTTDIPKASALTIGDTDTTWESVDLNTVQITNSAGEPIVR